MSLLMTKNTCIEYIAKHITTITATLFLLPIIGCDECKTSADCPAGQICVSGDCTNGGSLGDPSVEAASDMDEDTDSDTDGDTDEDSDSDTGRPAVCADDDECDDENPCTVDDCTADNICKNTAVPNDTPCADDQWCNGNEVCQEGECQADVGPCGDDDDPATICENEDGCNEEIDRCTSVAINEGEECGETEYCLGGEKRICQGGLCKEPAEYTNPCSNTECQMETCDEEQDKCTVTNTNEGFACNDGAPCEEGTCQTGLCQDKGDPCFPRNATNPCMSADCTPDNASPEGYTCTDKSNDNDTPCAVDHVCSATDSYCYEIGYGSSCWNGPTRPCHESPFDISRADTCVKTDDGTANCEDIVPSTTPIAVPLGLSDDLWANLYFNTREYYSYDGTCTGLDYRGMEAVLQLPIACIGRPTTITVSDTVIPSDVLVLHLTDYRDPTTCQAQGTNTLTIASPAATDQIILESNPGYPQDFDLNIECP